MLPATVFALGNTPEYLCGHTHDADCGYVEGDEGTPCAHAHDADCGYVEGSPCSDVHTHDASCGYVEGVPCAYIHTHGESCGYVAGALCTYSHTHDENCGYCEGSACPYVHIHNESCGYCEGSSCTYEHVHDDTCGYNADTGEGGTDTHTHDESCGYTEASPCTDAHTHDENCGYCEASDCTDVHTHDESCGYAESSLCTDAHVHNEDCGYIAAAPCAYSHTHDENCGYIQAVTCNHVHDASCGYSEPVLAAPCSHICEILSFNDFTPGVAVSTYEAESGDTFDDISAALPETLPGKLACAEGDVDIPLRWSCADFTGAEGIYTFRAELTNRHCVYAVEDDPDTEAVDEGELLFITVTVPEAAAPAPKTTPANNTYTISDDTNTVSVTGPMPEGAYLVVEGVAVETAQELLGESEAVVLFAYDIRIMLPGALDEATGEYGEPTEYQPTAENPVTVSITQPRPIEAPAVEVIHIAENEDTGETTPQSVATVTPTENSVEFEAEAFSVYVIKVINSTSATHTVNFPVGDFRIEYSTSESGTFLPLTLPTVTLGSTTGTQYDTLYFKVTPAGGFTLGAVTATDGASVAQTGDVYSLDVSGAAATTTIAITVTGVKIAGTPAQGQTLRAEVSSESSGTFSYSWQSRNTVDGDFTAITEATDTIFTLPNNATYDDQYIRVVAIDGTNTYNSAPVGPVTETGVITFDLSQGCVEIGLSDSGSYIYRGFNSAGVLLTGEHANTNEYVVTQTDTTVPTPNRIVLIGNGAVPEYNVTLNGIKCNTTTNTSIGGIYADAINATPMQLTLKLSGENNVGRIHYATSGESSLDPVIASSLTITSASGDASTLGSLVATSTSAWSAAIGGVDERTREAARNIYIKGGTITANGYGYSVSSSATGTCAIGGGGNGASNIVISGGSITAINNGTGATIGGGGGNNTEGGNASVTITGGTVHATNKYVSGVAIGGGSSNEEVGSMGKVTISGGTVTANGNIGGGSSNDMTGGNATVNISGGWVTVTNNGNIGGGSSNTGSGGSATVNISGGTVATPHVSGGKNSDGTYNDAELSIAAASVDIDDKSNINSVTGPDPDTGMALVVYCQTINIHSLSGFSGTVGNCHIDSASLTDGHTYELNDVYTDTSGLLYFWLPTKYSVTELTIGGESYSVAGALVQVATITHSSSAVGSVLGAALNYGTPTAYRWQRSATGTEEADDWADISDATTQSYIATNEDLNNYVRVIITAGSETITSGSLRITNTPHASITYTSLEAQTTLTAQLLNGSGVTYTYEWQIADGNSTSFTTIPDQIESTLLTTYDHIGKRVRVIITDGQTTHTTAFVSISPPTLNVTIPLETVVTVAADGTCTVSGGSVTNNSAVPVYLTGVDFNWQTSGNSDADELFYNYGLVTATLTLNNGTAYSFSGADPTAASPTAESGVVAAKNGDTAGTLALSWAFNLGSGNYLKLAPTVGSPAQVATITYTVDYLSPTTP